MSLLSVMYGPAHNVFSLTENGSFWWKLNLVAKRVCEGGYTGSLE